MHTSPLVRSLRRARGLNVRSLAVAAGLSHEAIRQIECGRVRRPRRATLDAIAVALGVPLDLLLAEFSEGVKRG